MGYPAASKLFSDGIACCKRRACRCSRLVRLSMQPHVRRAFGRVRRAAEPRVLGCYKLWFTLTAAVCCQWAMQPVIGICALCGSVALSAQLSWVACGCCRTGLDSIPSERERSGLGPLAGRHQWSIGTPWNGVNSGWASLISRARGSLRLDRGATAGWVAFSDLKVIDLKFRRCGSRPGT